MGETAHERRMRRAKESLDRHRREAAAAEPSPVPVEEEKPDRPDEKDPPRAPDFVPNLKRPSRPMVPPVIDKDEILVERYYAFYGTATAQGTKRQREQKKIMDFFPHVVWSFLWYRQEGMTPQEILVDDGFAVFARGEDSKYPECFPLTGDVIAEACSRLEATGWVEKVKGGAKYAAARPKPIVSENEAFEEVLRLIDAWDVDPELSAEIDRVVTRVARTTNNDEIEKRLERSK